MKKAIILSITLLASLQSFSQRKGFYLGFQAGAGLSSIYDHNVTNPDASYSARLYNAGSIQAGFMFNNHVGLFTGIGSSAYRFNFYGRVGIESMEIDQTQSFIEIPLFVRVVTSKYRKVGFLVNAGFIYSALSNAQFDGTIKYGSTTTATASGEPNKSDFESNNISLFALTGITIPAGKRLDINIGPEFRAMTQENFAPGDLEGKLFSVSFNGSLLFRLSK